MFKTGQRLPLVDEMYFPRNMVLCYQWNFWRCNSGVKQISIQKDTICPWRLGIVLLQGHYFCQKNLHCGFSNLILVFPEIFFHLWGGMDLPAADCIYMRAYGSQWGSRASIFVSCKRVKRKTKKKVYFSSRTVKDCRSCPLLVGFLDHSLSG